MTEGIGQALGVGLAVTSAISYAAVSIFIRKGERVGLTDHGLMITLVVNLVLLMPTIAIVGFDLVGPSPSAGVLWFAASGVLATLLGRLSLFSGIARIGPSRAGSIKNTAPVVAVIGGFAVFGERLAVLSLLGIVLGLAGLAVLVLEQTRPVSVARGSATKRVGMLFGIGAAIFFGSAQVTRLLGLGRLPDALLGTLIAAAASTVAYTTLLLVRGKLRATVQASVRHRNGHLVGAGVASALGMLSFNAALLFLPLSEVSVIAGAEVLFTVLFAALVLRRVELITRRVAAAALLVFSGMALIAAS